MTNPTLTWSFLLFKSFFLLTVGLSKYFRPYRHLPMLKGASSYTMTSGHY